MNKLISLFLIATALYSCGQDNSEFSTVVPIISKSISDTVVNSTPESLMDKFIEILRKDSFDIRVVNKVESLKFVKYSDSNTSFTPNALKILDSLKISFSVIQSFDVKLK
ncbi:MAG: hypothetical protein ACO3EE_05955 [Flavobacteriales bacterium]